VFVAMSINLRRILEYPQLPGRAAETLAMLVGALIVCSIGLVPGEPAWLLGAQYLVAGVVIWLFPTINLIRHSRHYRRYMGWGLVATVAFSQGATLPFMVAGIALMGGHAWGLYWLAPGVMFCFLAGVLNAWVLLVEIMR
jgi:hypothetical protein